MGNVSLSRTNRLGSSSGPRKVSPVMFPHGRARLATSSSPTGSPMTGTTRGMLLVACFAARAASEFVARMNIHPEAAVNPVADSGNRSTSPVRYSMRGSSLPRTRVRQVLAGRRRYCHEGCQDLRRQEANSRNSLGSAARAPRMATQWRYQPAQCIPPSHQIAHQVDAIRISGQAGYCEMRNVQPWLTETHLRAQALWEVVPTRNRTAATSARAWPGCAAGCGGAC